MCIIEKLKSNPTLSEVIEIYNKGNKIAIQNDFDIFIGFMNRVFLNGEVVNIEEEEVKCIKGVHLVKGNQINVKANTVLKIEFIYIDPYEEEYVAFVKPFRGKHKDYGVSLCIFSNDKTVDDKVYEIQEVCDEDRKLYPSKGVAGNKKELAEHLGTPKQGMYKRTRRYMSLVDALTLGIVE